MPQLLCATSVLCKKHPANKHVTLQSSFLNLGAVLVACMASSQWVTKFCFASSSLFRQTFGVLLSNYGVSVLPGEVSEEHLWIIFYCSCFSLVAHRDRNWQNAVLSQSESLTVLICGEKDPWCTYLWRLAGFTPLSGISYCSCFPALLQVAWAPPAMIINNSTALPFLYCELKQ